MEAVRLANGFVKILGAARELSSVLICIPREFTYSSHASRPPPAPKSCTRTIYRRMSGFAHSCLPSSSAPDRGG